MSTKIIVMLKNKMYSVIGIIKVIERRQATLKASHVDPTQMLDWVGAVTRWYAAFLWNFGKLQMCIVGKTDIWRKDISLADISPNGEFTDRIFDRTDKQVLFIYQTSEFYKITLCSLFTNMSIQSNNN